MRVTPIFAALLIAAPSMALAKDPDKSVLEWLKPTKLVAESFYASADYVYDSESQSGGQGLRLGARWPMPMASDLISLRADYIQLGTTKYGYPVYSPSHEHSKSRLDDIFDALEGKPLRNGDRTKAGYPAQKFSATYQPRGIELGIDARLPLNQNWALGARMAWIYDLSRVPELEGFEIANAKLKRGYAASYGITLTRKLGPNLSAGINYDHLVFTSSVKGDPQSWNDMGDQYLYGRRDFNAIGVSINYSL